MRGSFTKGSQRTTYAEAFFFSGWLRSYLGLVVESSNTKAKRATLRKDSCKKKHPIKGKVKWRNTAKCRANVRRIAQWASAVNVCIAAHYAESALLKHGVCAWNAIPDNNKWSFPAFCFSSPIVLFNEISFRKIPLTVLSYKAIPQP